MRVNRIIGLAIVACFTIGVELVAPEPPPSAASPSSGTIAYVRGGREIRLVEPDGANDRSLWTMPKTGSSVSDLAWRPDSKELAFVGDQEAACSWWNQDIYTMRPDGSALRRLTNSPACAQLASYPKGTVKVRVNNYSGDTLQVYVQGAPQVKTVGLADTVTIDDVADLGNGVVQPAVVILGGYRWFGGTAPDVKRGQTVTAGPIDVAYGGGVWHYGAERPSWSGDGTKLAYILGDCGSAYEISASPSPGSIGSKLIAGTGVFPCVVERGPSAERTNQFLYSVGTLGDVQGIFLGTEGKSLPSKPLVPIDSFNGDAVYDLKWLPNGSGFLYSKGYVDFGIFADIFRYDLDTGTTTQLTHFGVEEQVIRKLSVSPDGLNVAFELAKAFDSPTADLWVVGLDGSSPRLLVKNATSPAWSRVVPQASSSPRLPRVGCRLGSK